MLDERMLIPRPRSVMSRALEISMEMLRPERDDDREEREACERSLKTFSQKAWHVVEPENPFVPGWHIDCLIEHYEACLKRQILGLIVNIPPSHMKSLLTNILLFGYGWTQEPGLRWLFFSYSDSLTNRDSLRCRNLVTSEWYQKHWGHKIHLPPGERAISRFQNSRTGSRICGSIGGRGTGEKGHIAIIDDPIKAKDAGSDVKRAETNLWFSNTLPTRGIDPKTFVKILIMQRLHERDPSGYILARNIGWEHLCLPMEAEPKRIFFTPELAKEGRGGAKVRDAIILTSLQRNRPHLRDTREEGQILWPERFTKKEVDELKKELQVFGTAGQLAQRPSPEKGEIYVKESFRPARIESRDGKPTIVLGAYTEDGPPQIVAPLESMAMFQIVDTAMKRDQSAKFTAVLTCGIVSARDEVGSIIGRYLLFYDAWRCRLSVPEQYKILINLRRGRGRFDETSRSWTVPCELNPWPKSISVQAIEEKASGIGILQQAEADGVPFHPLSEPGGKVERSAQAATLMAQGKVFFLESMPDLVDFQDELLAFPAGAYSDWADCVAYAGIMFNREQFLARLAADSIAMQMSGCFSKSEEKQDNVFRYGDTEIVFPDD